MLIAIAGSQGAGKTSVINALNAKGYTVVERKTSRSILQEWGVTLEQVNIDVDLALQFQYEILLRKEQDEQQIIKESKNTIVVTERTYADLFTYFLVAFGKLNRLSNKIDEYYNLCVEKQNIYSKVFYLQSGYFKPENDGVRGINTHYSKMVDLIMLDVTKQMTSPNNLCIIATPSFDQRVAIIEDQLTELKRGTLF